MLIEDILNNDNNIPQIDNKKLDKVIDFNGNIICYLSKKKIYNVNGKEIAAYSNTIFDSDAKTLVYKGKCNDEEFELKVVKGCLLYNADIVGKVLHSRTKSPRGLLFFTGFLALLMLAIVGFIKFTPSHEDIIPNLNISDNNGVWGVEKEIEVFNDSVLAPGKSGEYEFIIKNDNEVELDYNMKISFTYNGKETKFPLNYKLKMNNILVDWTDITETSYTIEHLVFASNSSQLFTLIWEWPFDADNDFDTNIGNEGGVYKMCIDIDAQVVM